MKTIIFSVFIGILCMCGVAFADPFRGESVIYRSGTHNYPAIVVRAVDSTTADISVYGWDTLWTVQSTTFTSQETPLLFLAGIVHGDGVTDNTWSENTLVYVGSHVTGTSTPTLTIGGSGVQFSATKETIYTASVKVLTTLSISGGQEGHVDLRCDASSTPGTTVGTVSNESTGTLTIGLALQTSTTGQLQWRVPAAFYCRLVKTDDTGSPTYSVVNQTLQTLD